MTSATIAGTDARVSRGIVVAWLALTLLTIVIYWPGLRGYFEFDDYPNIVDNDALHVTTLAPSAWTKAVWGSPASDLQRPLASLSFALNFFLTGADPWPMKATNLALHLVNGWLLFALLRRLLSPARRQEQTTHDDWLALAIASLWMLHPINLTPVLFVVQRMETLAQTFVLIGLVAYVDARARQIAMRAGARWRLWIAFPLCLVLGIASKESAALLPLYALAIEATVLARAPRPRRELGVFYLVFLVVPACVGLAWLLPHAGVDAYSTRAFTLTQRLMTEPRVLVDYFVWTLLPLPGSFTFFHDDFVVSTGLVQPWTTLASMLALVALATTALVLRERRPLVALGILWFLAAHVLTATFIPLELVFEHRNYFSSAAVLLSAAALVADAFGTPRPRIAAAGAFGLLCVFSLALRARDWSDPVRLAVAESSRHPTSPRATYELGRTYLILSSNDAKAPATVRAFDALERARTVPRATILPETALIMLASRTGTPVDVAWWDGIIEKLKRRPPTVEDASAISALTTCQRRGECAIDDGKMLSIYLAALGGGARNPAVLSSYAVFAYNRMHDRELALRLARDAATGSDPQYAINLADFLMDLGDVDGARIEIERLRARNRFGKLTSAIAALEQRLANASP